MKYKKFVFPKKSIVSEYTAIYFAKKNIKIYLIITDMLIILMKIVRYVIIP